MTLRIRHIDPDATPSSQLSLETLARVLPQATVAHDERTRTADSQRGR
jgi:hypothetical protein